MDWKIELEKVFSNESGNPRLGVMESFIENLLEQEKKRMSDEIRKEMENAVKLPASDTVRDVLLIVLSRLEAIINKK